MSEPNPPGKAEPAVEQVHSIGDFIALLANVGARDLVLFRGQPVDLPLLPKIGRPELGFLKEGKHVEESESRMLSSFRLQAQPFVTHHPASDWEWLALAQHNGMATRLLDWSSNPLVALWFAVAEQPRHESAVVWGFAPSEHDLLLWDDPYGSYRDGGVRVFQPAHISPRIRAQAGYFTAHRPTPKDSRFTPLEKSEQHVKQLVKVVIHASARSGMRQRLNLFGVNEASIFPDLVGLSRHLSWLHSAELPGAGTSR